ncbi:MAG: hypothetical protein M0R37_03910 [Bacteroidales bacterium]|nr:hypothetical protein [Bacteroidales bacterium]
MRIPVLFLIPMDKSIYVHYVATSSCMVFITISTLTGCILRKNWFLYSLPFIVHINH